MERLILLCSVYRIKSGDLLTVNPDAFTGDTCAFTRAMPQFRVNAAQVLSVQPLCCYAINLNVSHHQEERKT